MEDKELIRLIHQGQTQYLNEIAQRYYDDIYYFCCYQTGSREDAYDLAQETFLRFIRYVENYRFQNLKGYLLTIAMNLCRDYIRSKTQDCSDRLPELVSENSPPVYPEGSLVLAQALRSLPDIQREAVLLHHFYGYKNREIAHMTGVSYAAVKSRVKQGLEKLKLILNKEDFYG